MTEQELIEQLADKEHASWARWMAYLFQCAECDVHADGSTTLRLPTIQVNRWRRQVRLAYTDLSEPEKQSDRAEVAHILPIIHEYTKDAGKARKRKARVAA